MTAKRSTLEHVHVLLVEDNSSDVILLRESLLVLFTDGLYEVENSRGEFYDQQLLMNAVQARVGLPAEGLFDSLLQVVKEFSATRDFIDDVCLVGVEIGAERIGSAAHGPKKDTIPRSADFSG